MPILDAPRSEAIHDMQDPDRTPMEMQETLKTWLLIPKEPIRNVLKHQKEAFSQTSSRLAKLRLSLQHFVHA
jgi:hypothetical protein